MHFFVFQWAPLALIGNPPASLYNYELFVYTGKPKNAATESNISFILAGIKGDTGIRQLNDGSRKVSKFTG